MPTRSSSPRRRRTRPGAAERVLPNHLGNVRVLTLDLLQLGLHHAHLVDVLDQPLRAGVAADHPLPALAERQLAPRAALRAGELHVDERARAVDRAPLADGLRARRARVGERGDGVEAAERLAAPFARQSDRAERGADGPRLAGVRMDDHVGVGDLAADEVHLRLHHRHVAVRAALEHELAPDGSKILQLTGVDPDVDGQHRGQRGHDLLGRPALALLVHDVRLEEHAAAHGQGRHGLGLEGAIGIVLERNVVALGHPLEEGAVPRRALGVQPEVGHRALAQDHDLDVGAAHVADHVGVGKEVERRRGMRHRLHHRHVGAQHVLEEILAVARQREPRHLGEARLAHLLEERLGVLDGIALGQRVAGEQQLALGREHHRLRGGAAEVAAHEHRARVDRRDLDGRRGRAGTLEVVRRDEGLEVAGAGDQGLAAALPSARPGPRPPTSAACPAPDRPPRPRARPGRSPRSPCRRSRAPPWAPRCSRRACGPPAA